jgi:hypothetical protein
MGGGSSVSGNVWASTLRRFMHNTRLRNHHIIIFFFCDL